MSYLFGGATHELAWPTPAVTAYPFSLVCWFRLTDHTDGLAHPLLGVYRTSGGIENRWHDIGISAVAGGKLVASTQQGTGFNDYGAAATAVTDESWHLAIGLFASSTSRIACFDGVSGTANTTDLTPTGLTETSAGAFMNASGGVSGNVGHRVAEAAVYTGILSAAQIAKLASGRTPGLVSRETLVFYRRFRDDVRDGAGTASFAAVGATASLTDHPRMIGAYPLLRRKRDRFAYTLHRRG